ncbi:MAG: tetratricopeptide repeat protein [Magnetospirillum sp.]|nr:tetratricopeptide repeat protein [Magnetospirillum sp.]
MASASDVSALIRAGRSGEAEQLCRKLLAQRPRDVELLLAHGVALMQMGQAEAALRPLNKALREQPGHAGAANTKGAALERLRRPAEAADAYRLALKSMPVADIWFNLGNACRHAKDEPGALEAYARAVALAPGRFQFLSALVGIKRRLCDWSGLDALTGQLVAALDDTRDIIDPFRTLALETTEAVQQAVARRWAARFGVPAPMAPAATAKPRLTIGYLSADLQQHATAHLMAEFFELHDRARFTVNAYSTAPDDGSPMRRRLLAAFDCFVDCSHLDAAAIARRMVADGVDIVVDLKGYTRNAATRVMAYRPAPVQAQWIGYPGTMGAPFIDYVLGDHVVLPDGVQQFYDEAIVRLPGCYQVNDRKRPRPRTAPSRAELGLPADGLVLACFNQPYKLRPAEFDIWMNLLRQVDGAVLWLFSDAGAAEANLRAEAPARGIDPGRVVFARRAEPADHLARYHHVDLFLDTLPYGAHTTASDALWMGCPVVTMVGETFAGRVGASLLHAAGLKRLVTRSPAEYEAAALALLRDGDERAAIRRHLWEDALSLPLFDTPTTTRAVERAYGLMWERAVAGLRPEPFDV